MMRMFWERRSAEDEVGREMGPISGFLGER